MFGQKTKFWSKGEICGQKANLWLKGEIVVKNRNFGKIGNCKLRHLWVSHGLIFSKFLNQCYSESENRENLEIGDEIEVENRKGTVIASRLRDEIEI